MSNLSIKAGSAVCDCMNPNACICEVKLQSGGSTEIYPLKKSPLLKLYDKGEGVKVNINIVGKCEQDGCPESYLEYSKNSEIKRIPLKKGENKQQLYFCEKEEIEENWLKQMGNDVFHYFSNLGVANLFKNPKKYLLKIKDCNSEDKFGEFGEIEIRPAVKFYLELGCYYDFGVGMRSIGEQQDGRTPAENNSEKNQESSYEKALPKDKSAWDKGWDVKTHRFEINKKLSLMGKFKLEVQGSEIEIAKLEDYWGKSGTSEKSCGVIGRVNELFDSLNNKLLPTPQGQKKEPYKIVDFKMEPLALAFCYRCEDDGDESQRSYFWGIGGAPFFECYFEIDLIQLIAAYGKVESIVAAARQALERKNNEDKNYAEVKCALRVTASLHLQFGLENKNKETNFHIEEGKAALEFMGYVSLECRTKVFIVDLLLNATAAIKTAGRLEIDKHDDGVDVVAAHDGMVLEILLKVEVKLDKVISLSKQRSVTYKETITIAEKLETADSTCRMNLGGKIRQVKSKHNPKKAINYTEMAMKDQ